MRTARMKGVRERSVVWKHTLRNALIPVITLTGLQFGFLLGGSIVVETVFSWPGLGRLLVDSVSFRDYPVIQAEIMLFSHRVRADQPAGRSAVRGWSIRRYGCDERSRDRRSPAREFGRVLAPLPPKPVPLTAGLVICSLIALAAVLAPWIAPFDPSAPDYDHVLEGPCWLHWCGTDAYGRDIFSRILWGGRSRSQSDSSRCRSAALSAC